MTRPRRTKPSNPTIPKTQATANETAVRAAYAENAREIAMQLNRLRNRLKTHKARFEASLCPGRIDWGYVGDLGHVATEISGFLALPPSWSALSKTSGGKE
jgi:hypothetical protein